MTLPVSLIPVRDRRDRTVGFELSTPSVVGVDIGVPHEDAARLALEFAPDYRRLCNKPLLMPITPAILREGFLSRFAQLDITLLVALQALEDRVVRRAAERAIASGVRLALDGAPGRVPLPAAFAGAVIAVDRSSLTDEEPERELRALRGAGLRPFVRGIDDRAIRLKAIRNGAVLYSGRALPRGASIGRNTKAEAGLLKVIDILADLSTGTSTGKLLDQRVEEDEQVGAMLLRLVSSASVGVRNARSLSHAVTMLGRDATLHALVIAGCRMAGEMMGDQDFAIMALRRVHFFEEIGARLDPVPHPEARTAAALLSLAEFTFNEPPEALLQTRFTESAPLIRAILQGIDEPLRKLLDLATCIDCGWWADAMMLCEETGIGINAVANSYRNAWERTREETTRLIQPQ